MKGMKKYYTQKIMWYLLTLVFAVLLNFILPRLMPGDPVSTIASKSVEGMTDATAIQKLLVESGWNERGHNQSAEPVYSAALNSRTHYSALCDEQR